MIKKKWIGVAAAVAFISAAVWYFASPYYALTQMRDAAEANDPDVLSGYIDYDSLREDLKTEFMAHMMAEAEKDQSGFGALGVALGSAMIGPLVDGMVSPAGVRAMLLSRERQATRTANSAPAPVKVDQDPIIERRGFSEFVVKSDSEADGAMVFKRHGLSWKLSGVDLPAPK